MDEAIRRLEESIRLDLHHPYIVYRYDWLGFAHLLLSRTDEAIFWFEKARSIMPTAAFAHGHLASPFMRLGAKPNAPLLNSPRPASWPEAMVIRALPA